MDRPAVAVAALDLTHAPQSTHPPGKNEGCKAHYQHKLTKISIGLDEGHTSQSKQSVKRI
jgi:hypothetical protein